MKTIILAGGYAKRMWPLTEDQPKALLPVAGRPIIEYILDRLAGFGGPVYVSTNEKFEPHFREWLLGLRGAGKPRLVVEPSTSEERKLGAVGGLAHVIRTQGIDDDLLVIAGDNLFEADLNRLLEFQSLKRTPVVAFHDLGDTENVRNRFGVCLLSPDSKIIHFQEKSSEPVSALASTGIYYFPREALPFIGEYLSGGNNPDAPGFFIDWLSRRTAVHGFVFSERWIDIGSFEFYARANEAYGRKGAGASPDAPARPRPAHPASPAGPQD
jgi:glucose-1-phosphate thymidylyltransferase